MCLEIHFPVITYLDMKSTRFNLCELYAKLIVLAEGMYYNVCNDLGRRRR